MDTLLSLHLLFGAVGLLVVAFVLFRHRARSLPEPDRVSQAVAAVADRVDPGEGPPLGVLSTPEKSRRMSGRFESAERQVRRRVRALTTVVRSSS
ncbi:MAG: hypothetical protein ACRDV1_07665 [Actinomycetes bacterium]